MPGTDRLMKVFLLVLSSVIPICVLLYSWPVISSYYLENHDLHFHNSRFQFNSQFREDLVELGIHDRADFIPMDKPLPELTFVTATSEGHVGEARALIVHISHKFPKKRVVVYDIGLFDGSRTWFKNACNVDLRSINLTRHGVGKDRIAYRWKPIVVATALDEFPAVFWMDTSTYFRNESWDDFIGSIELVPNEPSIFMLFPLNKTSVYATTNPTTYNYLEPLFDLKSLQKASGKVIFYRTRETYELGLKWWVLCALESECMDPIAARHTCVFRDKVHHYAGCHRYDQSALNVILGSYQHNDYTELGKRHFLTKRGWNAAANEYPFCPV